MATAKAKVVRLHGFGGPDVMQVEELDIGAPGPDEVVIRVGAFGLNRVEALYRSGGFGPVSFPAKIGYEAAGVIESIGSNVRVWKVGDRVATLYGLSMEQYGTYGERILYPANMLVPVPLDQTLTAAAASWMMYGTAYALIDVARIEPGDIVLINAASSSVGLAAIQIANDHGAVPIAITRGPGKATALRQHGAAHVIVSDEEDVTARALELTEGRGARVAFDAVGGAPLTQLLGAMTPLGVVIVYGMLAGMSVELMLPQMMLQNLTLRGYSADLLVRQAETRAEMVGYVTDGLARGALRPVIDRTFDLPDVVAAHRHLESNTQLGKIVVTTKTAHQ